MLTGLILNRFLWLSAGLLALFFVLQETLTTTTFMNALNAVFAGAVVTILAAYYRLIWSAVRGEGDYDRVRQLSMGLFLLWVSIVMTVGVSIYARTSDYYITTYAASAASRYVAIIAAFMQVNALDYGFALFHSRDKRMLWASLILGIAVMVVTFVFQEWY